MKKKSKVVTKKPVAKPIKKRKGDPDQLDVVRTEKVKSGKIEILRNSKTKVFNWRIVSANGLIIGSAVGLNTLQAAVKGIAACKKIMGSIK